MANFNLNENRTDHIELDKTLITKAFGLQTAGYRLYATGYRFSGVGTLD